MDNKRSKYHGGFTLVEMIVAVAIVAVLASLALYGLRAPSADVDAARLRTAAAELCDAVNTYNAFQNNTDRGVLDETALRSITGTPNGAFYKKEVLPAGMDDELWTLNVGLRQTHGDDFTQYWLVTMPLEDWKDVMDYITLNESQFMFETLSVLP